MKVPRLASFASLAAVSILAVVSMTLGPRPADSTQAPPDAARGSETGIGALGGPVSPSPGTVFRTTERFTLEEGDVHEVERGLFFVPVDRERPEAGVVALEFHRFAAEGPVTPGTPPIYELAGGPGFGGLGDRLDRKGYYEKWVRPLTRHTEYVSVGQRGFGSGRPTMRCGTSPEPTFDPTVAVKERMRAARDTARRCKAFWVDRGIALEGFQVLAAADDVAAVAELLGHEEIAILGNSFGSHWATALMHRHPDLVARTVLGGVEGPDHTYDLPSEVVNALERMAEDAEDSPELAEHVPEGGLVRTAESIIARLDDEPVTVTVESESDEEGDADTVEVRVDGDLVRELMEGGVTDPPDGRHRLASWPADVIDLADGHYDTIAREAADRMTTGFDSIPSATYFTYECGSGISPERRRALKTDPATSLIGRDMWLYEAVCPLFTEIDVGDEFRTGFSSTIPTVLVHGTWDTSTPLENAEELLTRLDNGRLVLVERGTHGAMWQTFDPEAPEAMRELNEALIRFLVTGETEGFPEKVVLDEVEWTLPRRADPDGGE